MGKWQLTGCHGDKQASPSHPFLVASNHKVLREMDGKRHPHCNGNSVSQVAHRKECVPLDIKDSHVIAQVHPAHQ